MEEIDTKVCLKKINKDLKNITKIVKKHKNNILRFSAKGIIKSVFHNKEKPINIEQVEIEKNKVI